MPKESIFKDPLSKPGRKNSFQITIDLIRIIFKMLICNWWSVLNYFFPVWGLLSIVPDFPEMRGNMCSTLYWLLGFKICFYHFNFCLQFYSCDSALLFWFSNITYIKQYIKHCLSLNAYGENCSSRWLTSHC